MTEGVTTLSAQTFDEAIADSGQPILIVFCAEWSAPCRSMEETLEALYEEIGESVKIARLDVDDAPDVARRHKVMSVPAVLVFDDGTEAKRVLGAMTSKQLEGEVREFLAGAEPDRTSGPPGGGIIDDDDFLYETMEDAAGSAGRSDDEEEISRYDERETGLDW